MSSDADRITALLGGLHHRSLAPIDLSLGRVHLFLQRLGNPETKLPPVIHVAGTNGKGSLLAYLSAMFDAAGISWHRYTSPHLIRFNERIVVAGKEIEDAMLLPLLERAAQEAAVIPVTFFEATTAASLLAFAEHPAEVCMLETGLGGRLDATNVVAHPVLTAITPVSFDHMEFLGGTLQSIAAEKAGILKPGVPCVVGTQLPQAEAVIEKRANELNVQLWRYGKEWQVTERDGAPHYISDQWIIPLYSSLAGAHQIHNAATAVACAEMLPQLNSHEHILQGLTRAVWPARLQRLQGGRLSMLLPAPDMLWLDGGHNPDAGAMLADWARTRPHKLVLICGMIRGKDTQGFLAPLAPYVQHVVAIHIPNESNSQTADEICAAANAVGLEVQRANDIPDAIRKAADLCSPGGDVLISGSLYLAGRVLSEEARP